MIPLGKLTFLCQFLFLSELFCLPLHSETWNEERSLFYLWNAKEMIKIRKVNTKKELKQFIQFYYDLYRGNENAVPFLYSDEMATLRRDKNPSFECCEAQYFLD